MKNNASSQQFERKLAQIAPIVRGLLAEPTGNQDIPYEPVILKSLTSKEAVDFADSAKNAEQVGWGLPHRKKIGGLQAHPTISSFCQVVRSRKVY